LLQAFKHDRDNYYTESFKYYAIRVPQVEGNAKFGSRIRAGEVNQDQARKLELACLKGLSRRTAGLLIKPSAGLGEPSSRDNDRPGIIARRRHRVSMQSSRKNAIKRTAK
jgi:hypothetical protein